MRRQRAASAEKRYPTALELIHLPPAAIRWQRRHKFLHSARRPEAARQTGEMIAQRADDRDATRVRTRCRRLAPEIREHKSAAQARQPRSAQEVRARGDGIADLNGPHRIKTAIVSLQQAVGGSAMPALSRPRNRTECERAHSARPRGRRSCGSCRPVSNCSTCSPRRTGWRVPA